MSIVEIFSIQHHKNQSYNKSPTLDASSASPSPITLKGGRLQKVETPFELKTRAKVNFYALKQTDKRLWARIRLNPTSITVIRWYKVFYSCK